MLQRIIMQDWAFIVPIISFTVTAGVFLLVTARAFRLPKEKREELSRIPLDETTRI